VRPTDQETVATVGAFEDEETRHGVGRRRSAAAHGWPTVEMQPDGGEVLTLLPPFACLDRFITAGRAAGNPHRGPLTHKLVYRQAQFTAVSPSTWPRTYWKRELPLGQTLHGSAVRDQVNAVPGDWRVNSVRSNTCSPRTTRGIGMSCRPAGRSRRDDRAYHLARVCDRFPRTISTRARSGSRGCCAQHHTSHRNEGFGLVL
jgi:hypothetical protein